MGNGVAATLEQILARYPGAQTYKPGDSAELNAHIIALMRAGRKTATCATPDEFADQPETYPEVGRVDIALDWEGNPALATRTLSLEKVTYSQMDASRVPSQGEFESLEDWQKGYAAYFRRNGGFDPDMMFIYERFEVVEDFAEEGNK
jgi:uncharacterized protein YhfF